MMPISIIVQRHSHETSNRTGWKATTTRSVAWLARSNDTLLVNSPRFFACRINPAYGL